MKKLLALCLTVMLVLAMVPVIGVAAADGATFVVSEATGHRGDKVTVAVSTQNNPGMTCAKVKIGYDADALELVDAVSGGFDTTPTQFGPLTKNPFTVNWNNGLKDIATDGDLAVLTFKIKDDASFGIYAIEVTYDQADVCTTKLEDVVFATQNGSITVECEHKKTNKVAAVDPTCTETGLTEGTVCADCGKILVAQKEVAALGHTEEVVGAKAHTADEDGYTGDVVCSVCETVITYGEVIPAGHVVEKKEAKEATCEDAGNIECYACTLCDAYFADAENLTDDDIIDEADVVIEAIGHKYGDWKVTKEATATEKGSKEKVCANCGDKVVEEIPALGTPATNGTTNNDNNKTDKGTTSPATNDMANIFVVVAMLVAAAAASVVVLKKKA